MNDKVNLAQKLATFSEHWSPRIVSEFNGHDVMVVKVKGEFNWHSHADTDDFFLVLKGRITIRLHDRDVTLEAGELFVVPKGVEHCPVADEEAEVLLIEPRGTPNTGDPETAVDKVRIQDVRWSALRGEVRWFAEINRIMLAGNGVPGEP